MRRRREAVGSRRKRRSVKKTLLPKVIVRSMRKGDLPGVISLWHRYRHEGLVVPNWEIPLLRRFLQINRGMSFVALCGGKVVGTVLGGTDMLRGMLHHLVVEKDYRRFGIGRKLEILAVAAIRRSGVLRVFYPVVDRGTANDRARVRHFKKAGVEFGLGITLGIRNLQPLRCRSR